MARVNYFKLNEELKPINKNTVKSIERNSARFIYVSKDGNAKCERCENEFTLDKSKHLSFAKCPKCHKTYQVIHTWRRSGNSSIHWEVTSKSVTDTTFVLRYYLVERKDGIITHSDECARLFVNTDKKETAKFELNFWTNKWNKGGRNYFREYGMGYVQNKLCCLGADVRESFFTELKKHDTFKYFDLKSIWSKSFYASSICFISSRMALYEKLQKVGLNSMIVAELNSYSDEIKYDSKATELTKMLGINKNSLNLLKVAPSLKALSLLQSVPNVSEREFMAFKSFSSYELKDINVLADRIGVTPYKVAIYLNNQGASVMEMSRYINHLEKLNYNVKDKSYSMPKDMAKESARLIEEENKQKAEFEAKKNELIKAVHDKLTSMPELKEFFEGAKGFMAYVPMTEEDFVNEGKSQHNCVGRGHYAESVAKNETLVFFIREIDKPNAPFVTMEYCNGSIVQCMLDKNERVKDDAKVYHFCSALANRLNECQILSA